MAEMTLQPTDVDILEEWIQAWRFAVSVLHLVSAKAQGVPTTDAQYQELLQEINTVLQNKYGGVLYYGAGSPVVDAGKEILMMVKGVDPSQTALIGASPVTDVTTTGLEVGGALATAGAGLFSKVGRKILISSIVAALGLQTVAALVPQEQKNDLYTSLDPYADDDGNVLVHTDSDGKTRVPKAYIEAVRGKLVSMGAYDIDYIFPQGHGSGTIRVTSVMPVKDLLNYALATYPKFSEYQIDANALNQINAFIANYDPDNTCLGEIVIHDTNQAFTGYSAFDINIYTSLHVGDDVNIGMNMYQVRHLSTFGRRDAGTGNTFTITSTSESYMVNMPLYDGVYTEETSTTFTAYVRNPNAVSHDGVEGVTPQPDAVLPKDTSVDIADYMPAWSTDKKTFKAVSYDDNRHIDGLTDIDFYPVELTGVEGENQDVTTPQDEAITGNAPSVSDMDYIFPAIQEFYEFIHNYPNYPDIVIPAGDSGDTPPENPDLLSGSSNGLWAIYNPSKSEVQQFGAWLWSSNILDQITRMFNSPIDAVIGFHMIYCTPITGASKTIKAGYLDSPVSAPEVTDQYKDIDCGTIAIPEYYRNALDYDNTRISLFLPFIGIVPLDTAQVMGSSLSILYRIDVLTGTCLAQVSVIKENSNAVMYTYQGNCSVQIPLTATTYTGMVGALLSGISAGASIMTGNIIGAVSAGIEGAMRAGTGLTGVRQSGTLGANAGALGIRIPYVIITHPVSVMPDNFNTLEGLPSAELVPLSSVSGFTRVTYVHLENIPATSQEIEEITGLLQTGVIF